ncbi:SET and MYND domain-containing protein 4 [Patella vulgata]|uniref:SET and MYND domain-containing protein 4 n=1 Tax=Patella vulgata TaxID=6465 RepID=UPI00217FE544|nr:SET and MYND domain-containing protein 4 [Patella vulgata]XP_055957978.1 SET and MYND domain-containing protein 4 [Patella vulgata]XP_055957979.1 SET and MYND domain-containing protein 4 [Patella vulgata]
MTSLDLYQYSLTATLLLVILVHSNWFHNAKDTKIMSKHHSHDSATHSSENKADVNVDKLPSKSKDDSLDLSESASNIDDKKALDFTCGTVARSKMDSSSKKHKPSELKTSAKYVDALGSEDSESEGICNNILGNNHEDDISSVKTRVSLSEIGIDTDMLNIGGLLLRHIQQLVCNAHAITELQASFDSLSSSTLVDEMSQVRVATAIYPTASLMNHSCDPTIISSFQGDLLVVRAVKNVEKGEEIFNCYGPHFRRMIRSRRQEVLKTQYFFTCSCKPCTDGKKDDVQFDAMVCGKCKGCIDTQVDVPCCIDCGEKESIHDRKMREEINTLYQLAMTSIDHSDLKGAMESLKPCLELCYKYLHKNNRLRASVEDSLARCYAMSGDYKMALKHLENSIKVTELLYGNESIELAYELQKMADILFNVKKPEKCLQIVNRAQKIFLIHFGENHETVKELNEMKVCLLEFVNNSKH